ncbi:MAG: DsbC family protein [Gammaproteobacteria bacterium]|nr:DsbC family protein [Gammaproteobacteria bacterium]MYD76874.1 DsbC family protein [Gammaproteobacteria bacterium]MYJ51993.1 DsbC family protein [Gammaproteobacteria bacterium]
MFYRLVLIFALAVSLTGVGHADESEEKLIENLMQLTSGTVQLEKVESSPAEGVYIVTMNSQEYFVYSKGDYLLVGDLYDAANQIDFGQERVNVKIATAIEGVPESEMILMGEPLERFVTVFTDTDCFYCQKFHDTVPELQSRGMQVRYLMFPRAGIGSESYFEAVSVWCSDDQAEAITVAKAGGTVEPASCENPVAGQYELGGTVGVQGTPTIILDNGKVINGYVDPDRLLAEAG